MPDVKTNEAAKDSKVTSEQFVERKVLMKRMKLRGDVKLRRVHPVLFKYDPVHRS